jgi:flagellar motor switch/type III secretory pathway protein FliN
MAASATRMANQADPGASGVEGAEHPIDSAAEEERWLPALVLPCELTVELPLPDFKVSDFLKLRRAAVFDARWRVGRDVPLRLNGTPIGWVEFEVSGNNLAVRLTEFV